MKQGEQEEEAFRPVEIREKLYEITKEVINPDTLHKYISRKYHRVPFKSNYLYGTKKTIELYKSKMERL